MPNTAIRRLLVVLPAVVLAIAGAGCSSGTTANAGASFTKHIIDDKNQPGNSHCKGIADFNGDGYKDVVVCSAAGDGVWWYEWPNWTKHAIRSSGRYSTDMQTGDVNGDGHPDIIIPKTPDGHIGNDMYWYENPGGDVTGNWTEHHIGPGGAHDVEVADLNGDGQLDVVSRMNTVSVFINQNHGASFQKNTYAPSGKEGTIIGDFDSDGDLDIANGGNGVFWYENTDGTGTKWTKHAIDSGWPRKTGMAVGDVNNDGKADIGVTCSESAKCSMVWYEQPSWAKHSIISGVSYVHTFKFRDMDGDGCLDAVWGEMHQSPKDRIAVSYNTDCKGIQWNTQVIDTSGIHNLRVDDIGGDGDLDIFGTNWNTGSPDQGAVKWFENTSQKPPKVGPGSDYSSSSSTGGMTGAGSGTQSGATVSCCIGLDSWHFNLADNSREGGLTGGYFGLGFGDIDGDGMTDIVSGKYFYKNPGGSMDGTWPRTTLPTAADGHLLIDVTGDGEPNDIIAEALPDVYWMHSGDNGKTWTSHRIAGDLPKTRHNDGRTMRAGHLVEGNSKTDFVVTAGGGDYLFQIPSDYQSNGNWPHTKITSTTHDEQKGLWLGDIDGDGNIDVAVGQGNGVTGVMWCKNPGNGSGDWQTHMIGNTDRASVKNICVADFNGDGKLDIAATEENRNASIYWFEQPAEGGDNWRKHEVGSGGYAELDSLSCGDINGDGKPEIAIGEIFDPKRVIVFENQNNGASFEAHTVSSGKESHNGAIMVDLNGDGKKDIVSIAYNARSDMYIWRNDGPQQ
jgi:hypothetical protein